MKESVLKIQVFLVTLSPAGMLKKERSAVLCVALIIVDLLNSVCERLKDASSTKFMYSSLSNNCEQHLNIGPKLQLFRI